MAVPDSVAPSEKRLGSAHVAMCLRKVAAGAGEDGVDVALRLQCDNEVRDVRCRQWWIQAKDEARATIGDVADVIGDFWIDVRVAQPTTDLLHAGERFARVGTGASCTGIWN